MSAESPPPERVTRTRPPLSADWQKRRAFGLPIWLYGTFIHRLLPDPRARALPAWTAEPEIVVAGKEARAYAERWISPLSEASLPYTFAIVQAVGPERLLERVAVAWLLREGLGLPQSIRELLPVIGSDWPEDCSAEDLVDGAAVLLWSRICAHGFDRRAELVDTFRSWGGFRDATAAAWAEWEAYLWPNGRRVVVEGGES